jgi:transcriptional regulator with GAF, ATPase, and Fis domain
MSDDDARDPATRLQKPPVAAQPTESAFVLTVTGGADKGKKFTVDGSQPSRVLLGQSPVCDLKLADPEASRRHAALEIVGAELRLTDLDSTNGTFVDLVKVVEARLRGGEVVRIGSTMLRVERVDQSRTVNPPEGAGFGRIIGSSRAMRRLYPLCARIAASNVAVVIEGETGTGKEVLAESLHEQSPRSAGPFVVFDCTAVPPTLVESELFGHERGAFTGAIASRRGVFEQAQGGTLFIDEIGDLDLALQPKFLRAIERSEIRRLGSENVIRVDVRIVAATRRDLDHEVQVGRFRDDLFHRLAVTRIELPPLRDREGDVRTLTHHFWRELGGDADAIPEELLRRWDDYPWPGNVRELRNAVARQLALGELSATWMSGDDEAGAVASGPPAAGDIVDRILATDLPFTQARDEVIEDFEQRYVAHVLARHGGDVGKAAAASGIGRRYFQKLRARRKS